MNKMEIFNEAVVLFLSYMLWAFTDYQDYPEVKFDSGWVYVFIIFLMVFFNFSVMIYLSVVLPVKAWWAKRKAAKHAKKM